VATLYARAVGSTLPVEEVVSQGSTRATVILSKWNEPIHVAAPAAERFPGYEAVKPYLRKTPQPTG
jgi:hypothetical protein